MFKWLFGKSEFHNQFENAILNSDFSESLIYRNKKTGLHGIKLLFSDNSNGMLWKNNNNYYLNFMAFDSIIKIPIHKFYGEKVWDKFNKKFDNNPAYLDI